MWLTHLCVDPIHSIHNMYIKFSVIAMHSCMYIYIQSTLIYTTVWQLDRGPPCIYNPSGPLYMADTTVTRIYVTNLLNLQYVLCPITS